MYLSVFIIRNEYDSSSLLKAFDGTMHQSSVVHEFFASLSKIKGAQNVIILWFSTGERELLLLCGVYVCECVCALVICHVVNKRS